MSDAEQKIFTLSGVAKAIAKTLAPVADLRYWVQAEVTQPREVGGHMYATLVEVVGSKQVAKLDCAIWRDSLARIRRRFAKEDLTFEFKSGTKVCLLCSVSFHATGGLKLVVFDADTNFQLGEMERKRREIIQRLEAEKLHERNCSLSVRMLPKKIGLITGKESAAMNDILRTLRDSGFDLTVLLAESLMQGEKCEAAILSSFDILERLGVDIIAIARGGGGKSELAALDNEFIARRVAGSAIPVWTAIGHETDVSVLDFVAHTHFKTPTALAEEIVRRYREQENFVHRALERYRREWAHRLEADLQEHADNITGLRQGTRKLQDVRVSELHSSWEHLRRFVSERMGGNREELAANVSSLRSALRRILDGQRQAIQAARRGLHAAGRRTLDHAATGLVGHQSRLSRNRVLRLLVDEHRHLSSRSTTIARGVVSAQARQTENLLSMVQRLRQGRFSTRLRSEAQLLAERHRFVLAHDPLQQLKRGYVIVQDHEKHYIKSVTEVKAGDGIGILFSDGQAAAIIQHTEEQHHGRTEDI